MCVHAMCICVCAPTRVRACVRDCSGGDVVDGGPTPKSNPNNEQVKNTELHGTSERVAGCSLCALLITIDNVRVTYQS